ncbi:PfkB family carbohydrate kinase, partial [Escherichia coli]|uniref:PfkB family carbohydrate kinase n=1 Tax=Escherichia coli TaxID=562 RepID=UPI003F75E40E
VETFTKRIAGAELNVAIGLTRLGMNVGWVSRVGNDSFGRFTLQQHFQDRLPFHRLRLDIAASDARGFDIVGKMRILFGHH